MILRKTTALEQQQFLKALEEFIAGARILTGTQRVRSDRIGSRCAAQPEIDAAWEQRFQHLETLSHH
jgi:hypothetical protein